MKKNAFFSIIVVIVLLLTACGKEIAEVVQEVLPDEEVIEEVPEVVEQETSVEEPAPVEEANVLDPEPRDLTFETPQGRTLQGRYYPAAIWNAPVIVLTHWVMGNQDDWKVVASWLQNRGQVAEGECSGPGGCTWWDNTWFPPMGNKSYAVFTYTLSSCEGGGGCTNWDGPTWVEDANAAILFASQLEGVDPTRIFTAGASIGADAAIDSCAWLNEQGSDAHCAGTASFSPGNYLSLPYAAQVTSLDQNGVPVWCMAAMSDGESFPTCNGANGDNYLKYEYEKGAHGMMLIAEDAIPDGTDKNTLELFLDMLDSMFSN